MRETTETRRAGAEDVTRRQIRGSSLLLAGRLLSAAVNFAAQVLVVRYLSQADYGAWAYALSVVALCQGFISLGLNRAATRFVPLYQERREYDKLFGTIALVSGTIVLGGLLVITAFFVYPGQISRFVNDEHQPLAILFVLIFLVPVEGLDGLLVGLFASFANPRAIFFRKHVLGPGLKLGVVILLILFKSEVLFLAYGYLAASGLGVLIYIWVLISMLRRQRLLEKFKLAQIKMPAKEFFSFTVPLMTTDLVTVLMYSSSALLLGYFSNMTEVAYFRVVLPAATLTTTVFIRSFTLLYTPAAARLFARNDMSGINDLYWRTAVWMAVLSFPVFALTFSTARPLTVFLYGARYEKSAAILAVLALGNYFNVVLGFNGLTLQVLNKVRYVVAANLLAAVTNVAVNLLLIPRFGAIGAGIGTASTLIAYNIFMQAGLRLASGISLFDKKYLPFYLQIALIAAGLFAVQSFLSAKIYVAVFLVGLASLFMFAASKRNLRLMETFPELVRLPLMRAIFT